MHGTKPALTTTSPAGRDTPAATRASRRALLGAAAVMPLAALPVVALAGTGNDAELLRLAAEFQRHQDRYLTLTITYYNVFDIPPEVDAELAAIAPFNHDLAEQIAELHAHTLAGHWQINERAGEFDPMTGDAAALSRHTGTDFLFPDPEGVCASTTIGIGSHKMPTWPEVTVDHAVGREEPLRLSRRLEPLHLPLSPSGRPMRILGTIIEIAACPVPDIWHDLPMRDTVTAQALGDEAPRLVLQPTVLRGARSFASAPTDSRCSGHTSRH